MVSDTTFNWEFDSDLETTEKLQMAVYQESMLFHPENSPIIFKSKNMLNKEVINQSLTNQSYKYDDNCNLDDSLQFKKLNLHENENDENILYKIQNKQLSKKSLSGENNSNLVGKTD